jgi:hypothetical protein
MSYSLEGIILRKVAGREETKITFLRDERYFLEQ